MMNIMPVKASEYTQTQELVRRAFAESAHTDGDEYQLIARLRAEPDYLPQFDVVAKDERGTIIGHAMLSQIAIVDGDKHTSALALAPLAVAPSQQGQGVGSALVNYLTAAATRAGYRAISILGDPAYYGRFGYVPASQFDVHASFEVPDAYYMLKQLRPGALTDVRGVVQYQPAFGI
ncbi:GNAT family N-acetyltransferase [Lacticaseibacillus songhuajiangensis]|uniref:GNAT family N-acetyltransferase n=1 Tax=Lacticaseibacillus songhuajiangensis TaxID=1296539 RepID=UPI000F76C67D|nr:N-acetyltransferase [Lacticaseibacillus songhuajiangensis]